ncbi:hypothetical protein C8Q70DRAFT_323790 [Cubamyces menziesii]|nr:hypothetical protein C8Q70DRAFT_323790 [Cubamyces menziesii]
MHTRPHTTPNAPTPRVRQNSSSSAPNVAGSGDMTYIRASSCCPGHCAPGREI